MTKKYFGTDGIRGKVNESKIGAGSIGPITDILQNKYSEIVCGQDKNYADWLTVI